MQQQTRHSLVTIPSEDKNQTSIGPLYSTISPTSIVLSENVSTQSQESVLTSPPLPEWDLTISQYSPNFQTPVTTSQPSSPPPIFGPSVLLSAFTGPWSHILTSAIFLCSVFVLVLLCFTLVFVLMIAFRRLWTYGYHYPPNSKKGWAYCLKYSAEAIPIRSTNWTPPIIPNPYILNNLSKAIVNAPPKPSAQFYPSKCPEIVAIAKSIQSAKIVSNTPQPSENIYMDIEAKSMPTPAPRSNPNQSTVQQQPSCYVTSIEDDANHAEEVRDMTTYSHIAPNRHYASATVVSSMPWANQHHQGPARPRLSSVNLLNAKASLRAPFPALSPGSMHSMLEQSTADCFSSYSEVILELKNRFNSTDISKVHVETQ